MFIMIEKRTIIENQGLSWKSVRMIILQLFFWLNRKNYLPIRYQRLK